MRFLPKGMLLFEIIELLKEMLLKQINWFTQIANQLILYKGKSRIINMVEELTSQDQSLEGVIDMVKNLIAQLEEKIKCAIKRTAQPEWSTLIQKLFKSILPCQISSYFTPYLNLSILLYQFLR